MIKAIDKTFPISYYIFMDINIIGNMEKGAATVRISADDPRMEAMIEAVLSPSFSRCDKGAAVNIFCCTGEAPRFSGPCIYVGNAPEKLLEGQILLPRPLDIELLLREAIALFERRILMTESGWGADTDRRSATLGEREVALTQREMELYLFLLSHVGECVTRSDIEKNVFPESDSNAADVYVCYLRKKLESISSAGVLISVRGQGYMLKKP